MTNSPNQTQNPGSIRRHSNRFDVRLSTPLVLAAVAAVATGITYGALEYVLRSPIRQIHSPSTAAWWPHLGLAALAVALLLTLTLCHRTPLPRLVLAPLTTTAAHRIHQTMRSATGRAVLAAPLVMLMLYNLWRAGEQILAGLDPNFTANAWGGPSYLGAMACHYLDLFWLTAVPAWLLNRLLLPAEPRI